MTYLQACTSPGADGPRWTQPVYAFMVNGQKLLGVYFINSHFDVRAAGKNEADPAKAISVPFIEQFLSKLKLN